jgi:hypothetical protein
MVNTPAEAISTFLRGRIDCLFLGDFVVRNRRPAAEPEQEDAANALEPVPTPVSFL